MPKEKETPAVNQRPNEAPFTVTTNDAADPTIIDETPPAAFAGSPAKTQKGKSDVDQA